MRFRPDGPSIPVELLEQRDRGNVVFFCGAGVSTPAGLPSFPELAKRVMRTLGTGEKSKSRALFEEGEGAQLDRVFNLLHHEYSRDQVDEAVNRILRTPRGANTAPHATILRLSRSAAGHPQVVTTNFDHLFERVDPSLDFHVGPALPDIRSVGSFEGLVYLHGRRWNPAASSRGRGKELILSSADFGRAYLADGWATRFVRDLLETYFIVLVGYSASDPPVRYLLEGLQSRRGSEASTIYAFEQGDFDTVVDRWRNLGVQALPYGPSPDRQHTALWNTLSAWATRADDPDEWRRSVAAIAQRSPRQLASFERGQVAALLRTSEGASAFAKATPPPSAEWVCVLDSSIRYARPRQGTGRDEPDPLSLYGLDDDPPRPESGADPDKADYEPVGIDLLSVTVADERRDRHKRLAGVWRQHSDPLPERLMHLADWYGGVAEQPTAMWWAAGYETLHPQLVAAVERRQHANAFNEPGRRFWNLLLERVHHSPERGDVDGWYPFVRRVEREGWTESTLRHFERAVTPYAVARRLSASWGPPHGDEEVGSSVARVGFELVFPGHDRDKLELPTQWLPDVFAIVRRGLYRSATLLAETERKYWQTASFVEAEDFGDRYLDDASKYLHWVRELFDRLSAEHPAVARDELGRWPIGERYFFAKLAIYAWGLPGVSDAQAAAQGLLGMPDEQFWDAGHRRELLHTLRARWNDFESETRRSLEVRIAKGRLPLESEDGEEHQSEVCRTAAVILGWLDRRGCPLSTPGLEGLRQSQASIPEWRDSWADAADHSLDGHAGFVTIQSDPAVLLDAPISTVADTAEKQISEDWRNLTRREPFQGLVEQYPRRALAALSLELHHKRYRPALWRDLLSHWPANASDRLLCVCASRLIGMPDTPLAQLQHEPTRWFRNNAKRIAARSPELSYRVFDRMLSVVSSRGPDATVSALGDVSIGGRRLRRSRKTIDHAINSAIGHLTAGLIEVLDGLRLAQGSGLPPAISARLEALLLTPGEGRDHAACLLARQLGWLYGLAPAWTRKHLIPLLTIGHDLCEPTWNGLLQSGQVPGPPLFSLIRRQFLGVFDGIARWQWDEQPRNRLVEFLVVACLWRRENKAYVSFQEARNALRAVDDPARAHALWFLGQLVQKPGTWVSFGRLFVQRAWPRESRYQTPRVARHLSFMAERSGDDFPDVVRTILPFVVATDQLDVTIHQLATEGQSTLATRFPEATLQLLDRLVPDDPRPTPYGLGSVLESIAASSPPLRGDGRWRRLRRIADRG